MLREGTGASLMESLSKKSYVWTFEQTEPIIMMNIIPVEEEQDKEERIRAEERRMNKNNQLIFSEEEIQAYIKYTDENVLSKEEFEGRCVICGEPLNELELPEGPERKVVCLKDRKYFATDFVDLKNDSII